MPFAVVLDADVLFPFTLRDTLLRAAAAGFYQLRWSPQILEEMERNLVSTGRVPRAKASKLRSVMEREFPEALVSGHEPLIAAMKNHEKDRHVVAASLKAGAQVIVTSNVKDFRVLPDGLQAQPPDEFLCNLFDLDGVAVVELLREQAESLLNPPVTFEELLTRLARTVPSFVAAVREHIGAT